MFLKAFQREVRVALKDVDNNRAPGDDVAMLRFFIETNKASDDVRAKSVEKQSHVSHLFTFELGLKYSRDKRSFSLGTAALAFLSLVIVHTVEDLDVSRCTSTFLLE